jgi:hypothetical protein
MTKPLRRRLQFGLGTLLLAVTVFGVWLGIAVNKAHQQRRAVAAIEALQAKLQFDYERDADGQRIPDARPPGPKWLRALLGEDYFRKVVLVDFAFGYTQLRGRSKVDDQSLSCVEALADLEFIDLDHNPAVTDKGLVHLRNLKNLRRLSMYHCNVTGTGFVHLKAAPQLRHLAISYTPLTREGVSVIGKLQTLESLSMAHTPVTDDDLAALESLDKLKLLWLDHTAVTDRGLVHLERLGALQSVRLPSSISDDAVSRLQKAQPICQITRE